MTSNSALSTIFFGFEDDIFKITLLTPDLAEGKTGATPYFLAGEIRSCTGFSGPQDGI